MWLHKKLRAKYNELQTSTLNNILDGNRQIVVT